MVSKFIATALLSTALMTGITKPILAPGPLRPNEMGRPFYYGIKLNSAR
jgi:hypothetical protein